VTCSCAGFTEATGDAGNSSTFILKLGFQLQASSDFEKHVRGLGRTVLVRFYVTSPVLDRGNMPGFSISCKGSGLVAKRSLVREMVTTEKLKHAQSEACKKGLIRFVL